MFLEFGHFLCEAGLITLVPSHRILILAFYKYFVINEQRLIFINIYLLIYH